MKLSFSGRWNNHSQAATFRSLKVTLLCHDIDATNPRVCCSTEILRAYDNGFRYRTLTSSQFRSRVCKLKNSLFSISSSPSPVINIAHCACFSRHNNSRKSLQRWNSPCLLPLSKIECNNIIMKKGGKLWAVRQICRLVSRQLSNFYALYFSALRTSTYGTLFFILTVFFFPFPLSHLRGRNFLLKRCRYCWRRRCRLSRKTKKLPSSVTLVIKIKVVYFSNISQSTVVLCSVYQLFVFN